MLIIIVKQFAFERNLHCSECWFIIAVFLSLAVKIPTANCFRRA